MGRKKNRQEKAPNHERWLVSYADFITLLFAVFVTLYAMSQVDQKRAEQVIQSLKESFGLVGRGATPAAEGSGVLPLMNVEPVEIPVEQNKGKYAEKEEMIALQAAIEAWLETAGIRGVTAEISRRGLVISLEGSSFFEPGSADLRQSAAPTLDRIASLLAPFSNPVRVEGFTDDRPSGSVRFPSNWELSSARASAVVRYLVGRDLTPGNLAATGYGEFYPVADNGTEEGRSRNRRVDIVLLAGMETEVAL